MEVRAERIQNIAADGEGDGRGSECQTAGKENSTAVHGSSVVRFYRTQILPVPQCAGFGRAHARQDVLFDQDVTCVAVGFQPSQDAGKIDAADPQFAEDAATQGFDIVQPFSAGLLRDTRVAILQMDVPNAVLEAVQTFDRCAFAGAVGIV